MRRVGLRVLTALSLGAAAYTIAVHGFLPPGRLVLPGMRAVFEDERLGPLRISVSRPARNIGLHRVLGRL